MNRFTRSIEQALRNENWCAALYLSLTLPDICARLETPDAKTGEKRYIAWFDEYLAERYIRRIGAERAPHVFLSGKDLYALRCSMLHEGAADITAQRCREALERFHFTTGGGCHLNQFNATLQLDVQAFCRDVCQAVEHWYESFKQNHADKAARVDELLVIHVGAHSVAPGIRIG